MITLGSILGAILRPLEEWYHSRYPPVVVSLQLREGSAVARVATFGQPIFLRSVTFELLGKVEEAVAMNQMIAPHGQLDCPLPRRVLAAVVLTDDVAISAKYRTASGREAESEAHVFNLVGGDGALAKVNDKGKDISITQCPRCSESVMFTNGGVTTKKELEARRKAYEKDLRKACPDHETSRLKFWA